MATPARVEVIIARLDDRLEATILAPGGDRVDAVRLVDRYHVLAGRIERGQAPASAVRRLRALLAERAELLAGEGAR